MELAYAGITHRKSRCVDPVDTLCYNPAMMDAISREEMPNPVHAAHVHLITTASTVGGMVALT